jgi:arylsulfatase A-like enzyme
LPSHVSLFTGTAPYEHGVTRRTKYSEQGDSIDPDQIRLPISAKENEYTTSLFSENPHFSRRVGFDKGVDFVDDWINFKYYPSNFSSTDYISTTNPGLSDIPAVGKAILSSKRPGVNMINTVWGGLQYLRGSQSSFPHQGKKVLDHIQRYLPDQEGPHLLVSNLMDTHNPHFHLPERGAEELGVSFSRAELEALKTASDNRMYLFTPDKRLPKQTQAYFETWDDVFKARSDVYKSQIRYFDFLVEDWYNAVSNEFHEETLLIVTGDHGQLFGEENRAGHHTSLHPSGINVPLYISFPSGWESQSHEISDVTSWNSLTEAIIETMDGEINSAKEFISALTKAERAVVTVDGSGYDVSEIKSDNRFNNNLVENINETRKVGFVEEDSMTVYESKWGQTSIQRRKYTIGDASRELKETTPEWNDHLPQDIEMWLREESDVGASQNVANGPISDRLEALGYK